MVRFKDYEDDEELQVEIIADGRTMEPDTIIMGASAQQAEDLRKTATLMRRLNAEVEEVYNLIHDLGQPDINDTESKFSVKMNARQLIAVHNAMVLAHFSPSS